ncbi:hypothetical protein TNIN_305801 [Trichonephila inaurata madagascariensis]|uniref:Uncharacterized protein n=1 Tax=Trichonephila inaurata madagascariensis TaxID=2747483 RepID=A0A8X6XMM9_9ARAC|nr:hypothetical protein TNIN_305801 [Trichonephila inaurata madagascariensis]
MPSNFLSKEAYAHIKAHPISCLYSSIMCRGCPKTNGTQTEASTTNSFCCGKRHGYLSRNYGQFKMWIDNKMQAVEWVVSQVFVFLPFPINLNSRDRVSYS